MARVLLQADDFDAVGEVVPDAREPCAAHAAAAEHQGAMAFLHGGQQSGLPGSGHTMKNRGRRNLGERLFHFTKEGARFTV